ncbi:DUF4214 domain-containing protein [Massilia terrae]|uniref:DUF4214 domain-containing protein n=1 Tax=Massilia terrae TaxID=1811224 RepID=A0ABT2D3F8_9BURK|nr:DUF4214 domain-containing protein [Massilia terrae]MCS0660777.1 DUF4214 domain-containing protein [Massilia terrae]
MTFRKMLSAIAIAAACLLSSNANATMSVGTGQFSSKLYTEGLGRIPDQAGWGGILNYWNGNSCGAATLQANARDILTSSEFLSRSPSGQEKAFRLYRAALNRDASTSELNSVINQLSSGVSWTTIVNNLVGTTEFLNRTSIYCGNSPIGWQNVVPANLVVTSTGAATNESNLRSALSAATSGSTVYIEQGAVIYLSSTLTIPSGVTLATVGLPGKAKGPLLGRLARNGTFTGPLVELLDNAGLKSVWVDDQRNRFGFPLDSNHHAINSPPVFAHGSNVAVTNNIISDSTSWTHLQYLNSGSTCDGGDVENNLITAFGSNHWDSTWSDGISIACKNVLVAYNEVIDATDVSIIVFTVYPDVQHSQVSNNTILNAGNSAWGGIVADALSNLPGTGYSSLPLSVQHDFTGTQFLNNVVWSSPSVHLDFVISTGTRAWFGSNSFTGKGAKFNGNNSGNQNVTTYVAIAVSGMVGASVQSNAFLALQPPTNVNNCGLRAVAVAPQPYADNFDVQPNIVVPVNDPIVIGCAWH